MASSSRTPSARRRAVKPLLVLLIAVAAAVGLVVGVRALWTSAKSHFASDTCTVGSYDLDPDQAAVASTMVGTVSKLRLPDRAAVLALAAGLQESKLTNLAPGEGDRDSVGVLQQRPSQGWGKAADLADPAYATGRFLDRLVQDRSWTTDDLATVIQKVQVSADGSLYTQHEPQAQAMADTLTGRTARGITCDFPAADAVAGASLVAAQVRADLPVAKPVVAGSQITVPNASWTTAAWFVANADRLGIDEVDCAGGRWLRGKHWRTDASIGATGVVAVLHH